MSYIKEAILDCIRSDPLLIPSTSQNTVFVLHIDRPDWFVKIPSAIPVFRGKTGSEVFLKVYDWVGKNLKWRKSGESVDLLDYPTPLDRTFYRDASDHSLENSGIPLLYYLRSDPTKRIELGNVVKIVQDSGIHREIMDFFFLTEVRDCCFHISEHNIV